jgi:hypothetical protein
MKDQTVGPGHKLYLEPAIEGHRTCTAQRKEEPCWYCTRAYAHKGDHAAHSDLGRTGPEDPVMQVARWSR